MNGKCDILTGDVLEWAANYDDPPFHALLTDPPYHLTSIVKRFGKEGSAPAKDRDGVYKRASGGFMGESWDGGDIAFRPETWESFGKHLHPGAFIMAFAGTRGYHRMACAIEDAGFIIHPAIGWVFHSGFPKATRIDTQIDAAANIEVERGKSFNMSGITNLKRYDEFMANGRTAVRHTPQTELAQAWSGHRYGLQAIKPSFEFICVAQKPYKGRPVDCITKTGAGALNIDGGRIAHSEDCRMMAVQSTGHDVYKQAGRYTPVLELKPEGRWPANLCMDDEAAIVCGDASVGYHVTDWQAEVEEQIRCSYPVGYHPKASTGERDKAGRTAPAISQCAYSEDCIADSGRGSGTSGVYSARRDGSLDGNITAPRMNIHPCVKPISLCKWLATLLIPPASYAHRRILVPFAGSGSEAIGALLAGWDEVQGIELSEQYASIARARTQFWSANIGLFESFSEEETINQGVLELL